MVSRFETFIGAPQLPPTAPNNSFVHESFPPGNKFGSQKQGPKEVMNRKQSVFDQKVNVSDSNERASNGKLPRLPYDNSPLMPRKHTNCAFVNNHKTYLRLKGFQLEDVYSLKRRKNQKAFSSNGNDNNFSTTAGGSVIDLPAIPSSYVNNTLKKRRSVSNKGPATDVWVPYDARKTDADSFRESFKELDGEIHIPGHVRRDFGKTKRLGKVLTNSRLKQILTEEEPIIPKAFYMDSTVTPRNGVLSSLY